LEILPARVNPKTNCNNPAMIPSHKKSSNAPKSVIAVKTMAVKPAAGRDTEMLELLKAPTTIPPIIPEITPDKGGAPEANAIPKHRGNATKNTTKPDAKF